jgi:PAS domain S-box-containing protein
LNAEPSAIKPKAVLTRHFLAGGGEMGNLMRAHDWASTPMGDVGTWSQSLRTVVRLMLSTNHPMFIFWGPDHICLYNDAYSALLGPEKHPSLLGEAGRKGWAEIWEIIGPQIDLVMVDGGSTWHVDHLIPIIRHGRLQNVYWTYSYSPIGDDSAATGIGGVLVVCNETSERVLLDRQAVFKAELEAGLNDINDSEKVIAICAELLGKYLGADSVGYSELDVTGEYVEPYRDWVADGFKGLSGRYRLDEYGPEMLVELNAGRTVVVDSIARHPLTSGAALQAAYAAIGVSAFACAPILRQGQLIGIFYALNTAPREWNDSDIAMLEDVAERTWNAVERARYVMALRESEARFQAIADSIDDMVWSSTAAGRNDYYNQRWHEFTGLEAAVAAQIEWYEMCHYDDKANVKNAWQQSLATGALLNHEFRLRHHSGEYRWVLCRATAALDDAGKITRWYGTCTDVQAIVDARNVLARSRDELEKLVAEKSMELMASENQLRQAQKMEAIGQLTGGIAHDFNNMLAVVLGSLALLKRVLLVDNKSDGNTETGIRALRHVDAAVDSAKRAASLTKRLLAFSRQQPLESEFIDANDLIESMSDMLRLTLGEDFTIQTTLASGLWHVHVDSSQLENVILNLAVNARDAMLDGRRLKIETNNCVLDAAYLVRHHGVATGEYVKISVTDEGVGMAPEVIAKSFEPFFTTKEVGKGTGLGLSQVYGFVKQSGGDVDIESQLGVGTTVSLYLPRALLAREGADADTMASSAHTAGVSCAITPHAVNEEARNALILVVEDEPSVRQFVVDAIDVLGYRVLHTNNAANALALLDEHPGINLLLSDIVMPDMNGRNLAIEAIRRRPKLKILLMTGYAKKNLLPTGAPDLTAELIWKPFTIEQLDAKLREMLRPDVAATHARY